MPIAYRRPTPQPPTRSVPRSEIQAYRRPGLTAITYTGPQPGAEPWELLFNGNPGATLLAGWKGYGTPKRKDFTQSSANVDGQVLTGHNWPARDVVLPVYLWHDGYANELDSLWAAWWASWPIGKAGTLAVTVRNSTRTLKVRLDENGADHEQDYDIFEKGGVPIVMSLIADDPLWRGPRDVRPFEPWLTERAMFDTADTGNVLNLNGAHTFETATINNLGDVPVRPDWKVYAPWTKVSVGVGSSIVTYPGASTTANDVLTITYEHGGPVVYLDHGDGVQIDVTDNLTSWGFAAVPPGQDVPLRVELEGGGRVEASLIPRFLRAW